MAHYLPVIVLDKDQLNKHNIFILTDEKGNRRKFYNFQNETTLPNMFKTFLKRHEDSQDSTKITAIPSTTYEILRNTTVSLNDQTKQYN